LLDRVHPVDDPLADLVPLLLAPVLLLPGVGTQERDLTQRRTCRIGKTPVRSDVPVSVYKGLVQPKREHYSQSPFNISSRIRSYSSSGSGSRLNSSAISGQIRSHSSGTISQDKSSFVIASAPPLLDSTRSRRCRRRTGRHPASDERRTAGTCLVTALHKPAVSPKVLVGPVLQPPDRKSTRLNSSHVKISYAVFCLKK